LRTPNTIVALAEETVKPHLSKIRSQTETGIHTVRHKVSVGKVKLSLQSG